MCGNETTGIDLLPWRILAKKIEKKKNTKMIQEPDAVLFKDKKTFNFKFGDPPHIHGLMV
jgi:hypothetical protein